MANSFYSGPSKGANRAAWTAAFLAEGAANSGKFFSHALLDMVKAFEMIPHHLIVLACPEYGYPLFILRLSLASYRLPRALGISGVYSILVVAICGIIAGSGFAASELKSLMLKVVRATS